MIRLDNVSKQNGHQLLFIEASAALQRGEKVGLVGPNGSGKTTTLRMITGLLRPDTGQVLVDGVDPAQDPLTARRRIGALTDGLGNYPRLSTREHLCYFG